MRWNRVLGVASLPFLGACAVLETSAGPTVKVTASAVPVDLPLGDTAGIVITVHNLGDRVVEVSDASCNNAFFISDRDGNAFNQAEQVYCTLELRLPVQLAPGQTHTINAFTTGRVIPQGSQDGPIMLAPGTYRVRPVVTARTGDEEAVLVSATPMMVTFRQN
ncbi:MAG TPA: hypothetical protein VF981_09005 [Gemmatimonadaceae bacterium]